MLPLSHPTNSCCGPTQWQVALAGKPCSFTSTCVKKLNFLKANILLVVLVVL
jgi:hypothetical protein